MKWQFVVTHILRQNEISELLDSWITNTMSQCCIHKQNASPYIFIKTKHA